MGLNELIKFIHNKHFYKEIKELKMNNVVNSKSKLATLSPFLDQNNIIRVGGRIENSQLEYNTKHPIVLPYHEKWVLMLVQDVHIKNLHVGPQGLLAIIRQKYWPLRGRQLTKKIVNQCYRCFRLSPRPLHQLMGNLPQERLIGTRPFLNTGVDFLGPINIHHKWKGKRIDKAYVCVFVCFATKAVHLEIVSDMSSAAFLGALTRFVSRRSCPETIYSDNGTNFKGAANSLKEICRLFENNSHMQTLDKFCIQRSIQWKFIPARSPHIGGLWEAAVKSVKKHFHKAVEGSMTLEQFSTIMAQIEAILNSRPLTPMSENPQDFNLLTPGHFLVGGPLTRLVNTSRNQCYYGVQEHWKVVEENLIQFWNRWSMEYLTELQKRFKWRKSIDNIEPNTLVLLKENNIPPMNWRRGRVLKCIVGNDGKCRMVEVKTSTGVTIRSVHNICPFPKNEDYSSGKNDCVMDKEKMSVKKENVDSKVNDSKVESIRRSTRIKQKNCITTLLLLLIVMPLIKAEKYVKSFNDKSGLLYENQGTVGLIRSHWDLILHANMDNYWADNDKINRILQELTEMTKSVQDDPLLLSATDQLQNKYIKIQQNNQIIVYRQFKRNQRMPRAPLQYIGSIYHSIFGLMDEEHAELLEEKINRSQANEEYVLELLKDKINIQNVTETILRRQNDVIWKNFNVVNKTMYSLTDEINKRIDIDLVLTAIANCNLFMETFETMQRDIIALLWNSKSNFIEKMLPFAEFQQQIKRMVTNLNDELQLPDLDPLVLAQTALVTARITNSTLLFNVKFPLISKHEMTAFILYSYPTWHDGYFVSIDARFRYLLINLQNAYYATLSEAQFHQCRKYNDLWLCPQDGPLHNLYSANICEIRLLIEHKIADDCNIKIEPPQDFWQQLLTTTSWVYSLRNETSINLECGANISKEILNGQGMVQVNHGCTLRTREFLYTSYENVKSDVNILWPKMNLSTNLPSLQHIKFNGKMEVFKIPDIPTPKTLFQLPSHWELDTHDVWHYSISFTNLIILVAAIAVISLILRRLCSATRNVMPINGFAF